VSILTWPANFNPHVRFIALVQVTATASGVVMLEGLFGFHCLTAMIQPSREVVQRVIQKSCG
jgi:hypothetical protein